MCVCVCGNRLPRYSWANTRHILSFLGNTIATFAVNGVLFLGESKGGNHAYSIQYTNSSLLFFVLPHLLQGHFTNSYMDNNELYLQPCVHPLTSFYCLWHLEAYSEFDELNSYSAWGLFFKHISFPPFKNKSPSRWKHKNDTNSNKHARQVGGNKVSINYPLNIININIVSRLSKVFLKLNIFINVDWGRNWNVDNHYRQRKCKVRIFN